MRVIVGSSDLELSVEIINKIAVNFSTADPGEAYGIRSAQNDRTPSIVEDLVGQIGPKLGRQVVSFSPTAGGRAAVFRRDYNMMEEASEVLAFFSADHEMEGGTGHVVKAALDRGVKVEAYVSQPDGTLAYLGSDDEDPDRRFKEQPNELLERMWREAQTA